MNILTSFPPTRQHRIVDLVVTSLTQDPQIRLVKRQFGRVLHLDDVMHHQPLLGLATGGAAVASLGDQSAPHLVPGPLAQIGPRILPPAAPSVMRGAGDRRQMLRIAAMGAKTARHAARREDRSACLARTRRMLDRTWPGLRLQASEARLTAGLARLGRPVFDLGTADDAGRDDDLLWPIPPLCDLARPRAADLLAVRRIEHGAADGAGFQHG